VDIGNTGTTATTAKAASTVALYASTDGVIDASSVKLATASKRLALKAGASSKLSLGIKEVALPVGTYTLLAQVKDASGDVSVSSTGQTVTIAEPVTALSATVTGLKPTAVVAGKTFSFTLIISNTGNIATTGRASIAVGLSEDGATVAIPITIIVQKLQIKPNAKPLMLHLKVKVPTSALGMSLYPIIDLTQDAATTSAVSNTAISIT
jgi:hypothetical protein